MNALRLCALAAIFTAVAFAQAETLLQQAITAHQAGRADDAASLYRQVLKLRPESVEARSNLGAVLASLGHFEEAATEYKLALRRGPNPGVSFNLALAYYKSGDLDKAATELSTLRALTPDQPQVTLVLADTWLQLGENKKVVALLTPVEAKNEKDLAVAYLLGTALIRDGDIERGQKLLDRILRDGESAEARLLLGTAKLGMADFAGALEEFQKSAALNPKLPAVNVYLGQALMSTGDTGGAAKAFRAELALNPNDFLANLNLAVLQKQDQQYDDALALLNRALRVRPGELRARYQVATIVLAQGKTEAARKELESILLEAPKFVEAHVSLATVYYRLKRKADGDRERAIVQKLNADAQQTRPKGEPIGPPAKSEP